jgi:predicted choloylglycine hydrolase
LAFALACTTSTDNETVAIPEEGEHPPKMDRELRELTLSSTGYELGLQHGRQLKKEIAEIVARWKENTARATGRDAEEVLDEFFQYAQFTDAIKQWTPDLYEEMRGIADGSEQDFNDIYVLNLLDEFWVYQNKLANHHCSDMGVPAINGNPSYIAQNMDIEEYTDGYQTLIRLEATESRPEQLLLTHPGLIVLNGMNAQGIGVVVNTIMQLRASSTGLPVAFVVRRIVNSTDKEDLLDFIQNVQHASGQNYIIGIDGEVFDFEASANKVVRFDPGHPNGVVYHTNHPIVNTDVKPWFFAFHPFFPDKARIQVSNTYIRIKALKDRLIENEAIDDAQIMDALRSKDDANNPVCRANRQTNSGFTFTFASVIMILTDEPSLQLTVGPPDESEYKQYSFDH